jgi:hypothetical protein
MARRWRIRDNEHVVVDTPLDVSQNETGFINSRLLFIFSFFFNFLPSCRISLLTREHGHEMDSSCMLILGFLFVLLMQIFGCVTLS